jgi:hypothetical protein
VSFFAFLAELPDETLGSEDAVRTRICTGFTGFKAFMAIANPQFLTGYIGITVRMILAIHGISPKSINLFIGKQKV